MIFAFRLTNDRITGANTIQLGKLNSGYLFATHLTRQKYEFYGNEKFRVICSSTNTTNQRLLTKLERNCGCTYFWRNRDRGWLEGWKEIYMHAYFPFNVKNSTSYSFLRRFNLKHMPMKNSLKEVLCNYKNISILKQNFYSRKCMYCKIHYIVIIWAVQGPFRTILFVQMHTSKFPIVYVISVQ